MLRLRTVCTALFALLALGAMSVSIASAAEIKPASGTFKGESKESSKLVAETKGTIECTSNTDEGTITSAKEGVLTVDFKGCTVFGIVGAHSLGDKEGIILVHGTVLLCDINKAKEEVGFEVHPENVHIEVAGKLLTVIGWAIGRITPVKSSTKTFTVKFAEKEGKTGIQEVKACEGGKEETLLTSEGTGAFEKSAEVATDSAEFSAAHEIIA
jgi:hypothetical protein